MHLWNVVVRFIFSSILQIWYVEVRISQSILLFLDNESRLYKPGVVLDKLVYITVSN